MDLSALLFPAALMNKTCFYYCLLICGVVKVPGEVTHSPFTVSPSVKIHHDSLHHSVPQSRILRSPGTQPSEVPQAPRLASLMLGWKPCSSRFPMKPPLFSSSFPVRIKRSVFPPYSDTPEASPSWLVSNCSSRSWTEGESSHQSL